MDYKNFSYEVKDIEEKGIVTIAISGLNNLDSDKDIIRPGAFKKTFREGKKRIKHVNQHRITDILGLPLRLYETDDQAIAVSQLNLEKQSVRDVFSDYKFFAEHGRSLEHSIGFSVIKTQVNEDINGIDITELKLWEYSTVTLGANSNTPLLDMKDLSIEDLEKYLRDYDVSEEKGKLIEKLITAFEPSADTHKEPLINTLDKLVSNF